MAPRTPGLTADARYRSFLDESLAALAEGGGVPNFDPVEDLLFERLDRMPSEVDPEIVLQDLYFVDRVVRPFAGPADKDYRIPYLVEALESRGFFNVSDANWEAIELYDDLCDLCGIQSYAALDEVLRRFRTYRAERDATPVEER